MPAFPLWPVAALPWVAMPIVLARRSRMDAVIADASESSDPGGGAAPLVSIVVPARNEAHHIEPCMRSILGGSWPRFELIVVNDHSTDGTGEIARRVVAAYSGAARVEVFDAPELPAGWFGKQWACHTGVQRAQGHVLLFTDADTRHGPEVVARALRSMDERGADMLSVWGAQEYGTFWERLLMPQVIAFIVARFGDAQRLNTSRNPRDKIANGQFVLIKREWYERVGGHEAIRSHVAEDLRLAQEVCRAGGSVQAVYGRDHLSTRMYEGLGALMNGWAKNVYAAGRDTLPLGPAGQAIIRVLFPFPTLWNVVPLVLGALALVGVFGGAFGPAVLWWAVTCYVASLAFWLVAYREQEVPAWYAFLHPLAGLMMFALFTRAAWRGARVEWKGRVYESASVGDAVDVGRSP